MKKFFRLIIVLLLAAMIGFVAFQWANIKTVWHTLTTSPEAVSAELEQITEQNRQKLKDDYNVSVPQPTREQTEKLLTGAKTGQQVVEELGLSEKSNQEATSASELIESYTAKLYAYRVEILAGLGGLRESTIEKWLALPKSERTAAKKSSLISEGIHECYVRESECDGKVKSILAELEGKLKAIGEDTSVCDLLWKQYASEKSAEKSYYLKNYLG